MTATMMTSQPDRASPALVVDDLTVGYGGSDVLRGVSLTVTDGGITCVVGPNGAGKSTLLATISGLLRPRTGRIALHGAELTGKSPRKILQMGVVQVPQNHSLFRDMTVRDNITLGGYILSDRRLVAQRFAGVLETFPQVVDWLGQKAGSLSGGQQRLVEFARCLMLDPAVVILDEPSMGLAPKVLRSVFAAIRMMNDAGEDDPAGRAERPGRAPAVHPRGGAGERPGAAVRHRPGGAGASRDRRALPGRNGAGQPGPRWPASQSAIIDRHSYA